MSANQKFRHFESATTPKPAPPTVWDTFWKKVETHFPADNSPRFALTEKGRQALEEMKK